MKHQQVNVDYWEMARAMLAYSFLAVMCWVMLRLFNAVFMLPRRMRSQQENLQNVVKELQKRFPDLNVTEEELIEAEKEVEQMLKESEEKENNNAVETTTTVEPALENKKDL